MKTIIERGASWTLDETKLLLTLWGQDQVQRKDTPHKRTKEVYERIANMFNQRGFERTPEQVRTRVFNMIAEYRRILKDPNPEKMKKCVFFNAMHNIYQAQHWSDVKSIVDDYEPDQTFSPASNSKLSEMNDDSVSDGETMGPTDGQNHDSSSMEAINTGTNLNNNNTNDSSGPKSNTNNDTTAPKSNNDTATNAATNNSNSESGTNNNTSATRDNIVNNSITETSAAKKSQATSADKSVSSKKIKLDPSAPGPSQGGAGTETSSTNTDGKQNKSSISNNVGTTSSSTANAQNASSSSTQPPTPATSSTLSGKLQSLLAASASSTTSTPTASRTAPGNNSATHNNFNSTKSPFMRRPNGGESINTNGTQPTATRIQPTASITSHQLYQAPINTFDVTSSALLIDRMFAHLSRESENMREWIALEKDRIALEKARRAQEVERESRRERVLIDTLMKFQEQWISYVSRRDPRFKDNSFPRMNIPPKETDTLLQTTQIDLPADVSGSNTTLAPVDLPTSAGNVASGEGSSTKACTSGSNQTAPNPATPTTTAS